VPELAALSGLSRAAFARILQLALGQPPIQYLTEWRMTLARDHLRAGELTLTQIGTRTGYASPTPSPPRSDATTEFHPANGDKNRRQARKPHRQPQTGVMELERAAASPTRLYPLRLEPFRL
jgi:AraC-like DNA-binding protein